MVSSLQPWVQITCTSPKLSLASSSARLTATQIELVGALMEEWSRRRRSGPQGSSSERGRRRLDKALPRWRQVLKEAEEGGGGEGGRKAARRGGVGAAKASGARRRREREKGGGEGKAKGRAKGKRRRKEK